MYRILYVILCLFYVQSLSARKVLSDIDLNDGNWVMVGVSLRNAKLHPVQDTLGTFILKDKNILSRIQNEWDFSPMFEDVCDYHYALKFYKNGELKLTLRLNLVCEYIILGGAAFDFTAEDLLKYRSYYKPINWSRITFKNMDVMKEAVNKMLVLPGVYPYMDIRPYKYNGYFTVGYDRLHWNANKDSLTRELSKNLRELSGRSDFHPVPTFIWVQGDFMNIRYEVYCDTDFMNFYRGPKITEWRSHLEYLDNVQIIVVGLSKENYQKVMAPVLQSLPENEKQEKNN
jgi:hypothetical protein